MGQEHERARRAPKGTTVGLYERLLKEKEEEERHRGRPLGAFYGLDSPVLDRRLASVTKDRVGDRADLYVLYQYTRKGVRSQGDAYRFHSLRSRYPKEHAELKAEVQGQGSFRRRRSVFDTDTRMVV